MTTRFQIAIATIAIALLSLGCASSSSSSSSTRIVDPLDSPPEGQALVVFMRPSAMMAAARTFSLFDITDGTEILGTLGSGTKTTTTFPPGKRTFMGTIAGQRAVMEAEIEAGKIYYVKVYGAQLSALSPQTHAAVIKKYWGGTKLVTVTERDAEWSQKNLSSIQSHKANALQTWDRWTERQREKFRLSLEDGVESPIL